jgi:Cytochrome c
MTAKRLIVILAAIAATGCGGPAGTSSSDQSQPPADRASIATYQELTANVQSAALAYGNSMSGPGMTMAGCAAAHDAYDTQVRPWMSRMVQMGGSMDGFMDGHSGATYADMSCAANAMLAELDAHRHAACTFGTLSQDQAEAARHAGVMTSYAGHMYDRCGQMMGGLDGHGYMWGSPWIGCGGAPGGSPTDPVALGQRIFFQGIGATGQAIVRTGGSGMMMMGGCASCHGSDGHGRRTMMFTTPNITYANLTDAAGMLEPDGSRGPTYTDELIRRAVTQGIDPDGQNLDAFMPRWQLTDEDWNDLLLFLKTLP